MRSGPHWCRVRSLGAHQNIAGQHCRRCRCIPRRPFDAKALERLCQRHQIRTLSLFGSRLKGTARPDSDVDQLVEFLPDARPTLLDMAEIEREFSELLDGATVDLRTAQDLSRYFRDEVVKEAELQYAA